MWGHAACSQGAPAGETAWLDGGSVAWYERGMPTTTVRELMTSIVETLTVGDTLLTARDQLEKGRIRHLPVVDGNERLVGLITHRHIVAAWISHGRPATESADRVAADVPVEMLMERDVLTVHPETAAAEAARPGTTAAARACSCGS